MIKPLKGFVLVEPIEEELKQGNVYLPESSKDKPNKAVVVSVSEKPLVNVGDTIYHKKWVNETVDYEGKEYLFVKNEDILGVIDGK